MNRQQQIIASKKASQVYDLKVRGWRNSEIAASLGIGERQVRWLIQEGDRLTDGRIRQMSRDGALRQLLLGHEHRERKLWDLVVTAKTEVVRAMCLRQLIEEERRFEELLVRMRVIPKAVDLKTEHDVTYTERKDLRIQVRVDYADAELAERFTDLVSRVH